MVLYSFPNHVKLFSQDYSNLTKADVFSLALTVISASGAEPMPSNGDKWHQIRQGKLPPIPQVLSQQFLSLLKVRTILAFPSRSALRSRKSI